MPSCKDTVNQDFTLSVFTGGRVSHVEDVNGNRWQAAIPRGSWPCFSVGKFPLARWKAAGQVQQTPKQREASSAAQVHVCSWSRGWKVSSVGLQHGVEVIWHFRTVSLSSAQFPLEDCCVMTLYYLHTSFGGCKPFLLPHEAFGHLWAQCPVLHLPFPMRFGELGPIMAGGMDRVVSDEPLYK